MLAEFLLTKVRNVAWATNRNKMFVEVLQLLLKLKLKKMKLNEKYI